MIKAYLLFLKMLVLRKFNMKIYSPLATGNGAFVIHKYLEKHLNNYHVAPYNPWQTLFPPLLMLQAIKYKKPDLIHTTPDYAIWSKLKRKPLIVTFHNYVLDDFMKPYSSLLQRLHYQTDLRYFTKQAAESAIALTAVSEFTAKLLQKDLKINKEVTVIRNGIDENIFSPVQRKPKNNKLKVLFSGNLTQRKGAHWLFEIAQHLSNSIRIDYTQGLRTNLKLPSHPRLRCIGAIDYKDMPDLYRQYDILLSPTVREGLPMAVLEAMGCGLPVVATDCSSLPELITESIGGYLCPLGDVQCFTEKLNQLADSQQLRRTMGEFNRERIENHFTLQHMITEYQNLFERIESA